MRIATIILFSIIFVTLFSACSNSNANEQTANNEETAQSETTATNDTNTNTQQAKGLNDLVDYFESEGYDIGEKEMKATDMVGAYSGFGIDINDEQIELYLYLDDSEDLQEIKENNAYHMDGITIPAINNGNIVLMGHDDHPDHKDIIKTFESF